MSTQKPIYEFVPTTGEITTKRRNDKSHFVIGFTFFTFSILSCAPFFFNKDDKAICYSDDKIIPCEELYSTFIIFSLIFFCIGFWVVISPIFDKKKNTAPHQKIYRCYDDYIELYGIKVKRKNMVDIHFGYNIGAKKKKIGYIVINTNIAIRQTDNDEEADNCIALEDVPNVEDAYFKIKYLYNLPDKKK